MLKISGLVIMIGLCMSSLMSAHDVGGYGMHKACVENLYSAMRDLKIERRHEVMAQCTRKPEEKISLIKRVIDYAQEKQDATTSAAATDSLWQEKRDNDWFWRRYPDIAITLVGLAAFFGGIGLGAQR